MKKLIFSSLILLLTACQTQFPILSDDSGLETNSTSLDDIEKAQCQGSSQKISTADNLLPINKMVDAMIQSKPVLTASAERRLRVYIPPVLPAHNNEAMDNKLLNQTIRNRVQRSGKFVLVATLDDSEYQLKGAFSQACLTAQDKLSLQLITNMTKKIIWSKTHVFQ